MKLAISNIAWNPDEDEAVCRLMQKYDISGVEIAPTKIWSKPLDASKDEIASYATLWSSRGLEISSMQALLFGRPDLTIFGSSQKRDETLEYLKGIIRLGGNLGVTALVFGSPGNRRVGDLDRGVAEEIAVDFFRSLGNFAVAHNTVFCIEPNPAAYGCDFITTSEQGRELVEKVDHKGFGLHLDAAGMTMSQENLEPQLVKSIPKLCHFHVSEPELAPIGSGGVEHALFSHCLRKYGYRRWVSIEMRAPGKFENITGIELALKVVRKFYN